MKSRKLNKDKLKEICIYGQGEENYCNGFFNFNISEMLKGIDSGLVKYTLVSIPLKELKAFACNALEIDYEHIVAADVTRPVILLEIAPDYKDYLPDIPEDEYNIRGYSLADGNHRIAKAEKLGLKTLPAYLIRMEDHVKYMYTHTDEYADYWNMKLKEREKDAKQNTQA